MRRQIKRLIPRFKRGSERERILTGIDYVMKSGGGSLKSQLTIKQIK